MAEVENGSAHEPIQTSTGLSQADNKENGVDVSTYAESPEAIEEDKPTLPDESERLQFNVDEIANNNEAQGELEPGDGLGSPEQVSTSPGNTVAPPQLEDDPEHAPSQQDERTDGPADDQTVNLPKNTPSETQEAGSAPPPDVIPDLRVRSDSRSTTATLATQRSVTVSSTVFIVTALDTIGLSREARRSKELEDAVNAALANVKQSDRLPIDPEVIFRPLHLATKSFSIPLQVTALDCIGKLITYSYFAFPSTQTETESGSGQPPLIERAIDAICDCFENEATPNEIQQQIIKSLLAAVLNDKIVVHGAGLLKAVRQIYNIFIYSKSSQNQQIAQGSLTQMVGTVFDRVRVRLELKELRVREGDKGQGITSDTVNLEPDDAAQTNEEDHTSDVVSGTPPDQPVSKEPIEKLTLQSFESSKDVTSVNDNAPTTVTRAKIGQTPARPSSMILGEEREDSDSPADDDEDEIYVKDSYLVFRALCKLSHKILGHDQQQDLKSQNMRSNSNSTDAMTLLQAKELEVFLKEIYLAILEKRNSPTFQKQYFMEILERLAGDPRALVEIYLNYDCDRTALENIFQNVIEQLSRYSSVPVAVTAFQQQQYQEHYVKVSKLGNEWHQHGTLPPTLTSANISNSSQMNLQGVPPEYILKNQAVECLVEILQSLDNWASQRIADHTAAAPNRSSQKSIDNSRESLDTNAGAYLSSPRIDGDGSTGRSTPVAEDDPSQIEKVKQRKIALTNAVQQFNFKPKRGIKLFIKEGFVRSDSPEDLAAFLIRNERLDKAMLGEYLGEGDAENIAIMHAFVDTMDFAKRRFVDALRQFLQHFRLPGEAQKIDRFMLKFAERYTTQNPNAYANADTAYVLAYSVIMLNTDQHSSKIRGNRMTKEDFIKNNRGINDNQDLPDDYLGSIYDEIANNEIVLDTEREHAANIGLPASTPSGLASRAGQVFATVGRDIQGEKYAQASEEMANKTEQLYRSLIRAQRKTAVKEALSRFIPATSVQHVGSMFNVTWMSFLSGLSAPMQDTQYLEIIKLCMEGMKLAIRISCAFDLETPRVAFVTALAKFTNLGNIREMMAKHVEALKVLLDVALTEGNRLKNSWREILTCVSQLDRLQLLTDGVDEGSLPDVSRARIVPHASSDTSSRRSIQSSRRPRPRSINGPTAFRAEVAMESRSAEMIRGVDRIFTNTANLSHDAIIEFVRALSEVSWQEIQSSGQTDSPRTYSLQKLVEISYYNMTRVRIEWSKIWEVLGQHFNQVGCHSNTTVVFFALDSLRQLSMRFMEIEELPGFKFQKDFLKPFEHVMANSNAVTVKDMILRCLIQMIQARGDNIRSGWKTMFGVFTVAAREPYGKCLESKAFFQQF
ncbi:hypothetical protein EYZ11_007541 [Aspergillus tanneri]|uniref:SEC7 domain-containing protein n=1 Tax=Aspergillus tanneri TaxID=1220188 RepID=A0A4S3JCZ1_9EURO|nr:hypothetical protein EYZ11_007541 [Aspergillus tanneri]